MTQRFGENVQQMTMSGTLQIVEGSPVNHTQPDIVWK
jgi:hypothetical protein